MTTTTSRPEAVGQYLEQLRHALRFARKGDREDYLAQITDHLDERLVDIGADDSEALSTLLLRMGAPFDLASEFYSAERAKFSVPRRITHWLRRWWIGIALVAVITSGLSLEAWASHYQPLSLNLSGGYLDSVVALSGQAPVKLSEGTSAPFTWKLTDGRYRVSILFAADNGNSLAVTISPPQIVPGVPNPVSWHLESNRSTKQSPFVSARVAGHWYREIVFTTTYNCTPWSKGNPNATGHETTYVTTLPVVMSFWGNQHTLELPVQPFYLEFVGDCFGN